MSIHQHDFSIAGCLSCADAPFDIVAGYALAPAACLLIVPDVREVVDVEVAAVPLAGGEDDIAVGQFLAFRLVAAHAGAVLAVETGGAQNVPRQTEVIAVDDVVAGHILLVHLRASQYRAIQAVVFIFPDDAALHDAPGADEHGTRVGQHLVERVGDIFCLGPRAATVGAVPAGDAVGLLARTIYIYYIAGDRHAENAVRGAVCHHSHIAVATVIGTFDSRAPLDHGVCRPGATVVLARAGGNVDFAVTDIQDAVAPVGDGNQMTLASGGDGGNTVGNVVTVKGVEKALGTFGQRLSLHLGDGRCSKGKSQQQEGEFFHRSTFYRCFRHKDKAFF